MRRTPKVLLLLILSGFYSATHAIDLSKINLNYQYLTETDITVAHRVVEAGTDLTVYYEVNARNFEGWSQHFLLQSTYNSVAHDTLKVYTLDTLAKSEKKVVFKLTFNKPSQALLLVAWANMDMGKFRIQDIRVKSPVGFPRYVPVDASGLPFLSNYMTADTIAIQGPVSRYHTFRYQDNFGPADPAMGMMKQIAPSLAIDSSFYFDGTLKAQKNFNFYLIQTDTLSQKAITLLKCPEYYPKLRRLEELILPLTYISTTSEIKTLKDSKSKKAFENFWISTYGSKFRAKAAIRLFYGQIETVNELFTDYKQGWKTDRGMIYLIFGPPNKVFRSERTEVWEYNDGTEFEFIRISTLFTPSMYSLKRSRDYEELWYERVGQIRRGI